jgi:imidazole glycerol-phosphate synthase subunit HisF
MLKRVIPILLVEKGELIKTVQFGNPTYIGDLINSIKIYNELEVDELCILDKSAKFSGINFSLLKQVVSECFMPLSYAGGVSNVEQVGELLKLGIEKVIVSSNLYDFEFLKNAVQVFGSSTIAVCVDYKFEQNKRVVYTSNGKNTNGLEVENLLIQLNEIGVGEVMLQSIDYDGTYHGYDFELVSKASNLINNPLIISGGCSSIEDIKKAFDLGVSACAAGSLCVYYTNAKGILINYPDSEEFRNFDIIR